MAKASASKPDKADDPIHFTEAYRLAKRNVLFWGAVTILVAVGTAPTGGSLEVSAMVKDLHFAKGFLTLASLLVLVFMAVGYYRAEKVLLARHTGFALAHMMHENADLAVTVGRELLNTKGNVEAAEHYLTAARQRLDKAQGEFENLIQRADSEVERWATTSIPNFQAAARLPPEGERPVLTVVHVREAIAHVQSTGKDWLRKQGETLRTNSISRVRSAIKKIEIAATVAGGDIERARTEVIESEAAFAKLSAQLHGFADTIDVGEKRFFYWHDRAPVICTTLIAAAAAIWSLAAPATLTWTMQRAFDRPPVEGKAQQGIATEPAIPSPASTRLTN